MLSPEALAQIDREVAKYPPGRGQSAVMSALRIAQVEKGWLSEEVIRFIAAYLAMPPVVVYEVATFYNMYETGPVGRFKLTLCTNISCMLMGAPEIAAHLKQRLGVEFGETTPDGLFTLKEGECMGACGDAPLCLVNNHRMEGGLTVERVDALLDELKNRKGD